MSGIFGMFCLDGAPVTDGELRSMGSLLTRRGPDRSGAWRGDAIGLGHTLLATTPEALGEVLPLTHPETGCVITADARLDNRPELLHALGRSDQVPALGDAEIILAAYLAWGEVCLDRFLGDFAFTIWDPRQDRLFCARDHFGMRPFYHHHTPGRFFVFASEPRAILVLPQTPYRINEGRIADYLVRELVGIDKTSTFFEEVYRLPPAHAMSVSREGVRQWRYWTLEPGPELRLPTNEAYAEAFLEVFTEAVRCRLRSSGPVGSMLSGGMDSGSIVAVATRLLAQSGRGPLHTFSAVSPDPSTCIETRMIKASLTMAGLAPHVVSYGALEELMPDLEELTRLQDEPFLGSMTLMRAVYLMAHRVGINVVLDGGSGDIILSEGNYLARLLRGGQWLQAVRGLVGYKRFYGKGFAFLPELTSAFRLAFAPPWLKRFWRGLNPHRTQNRVEARIRDTLINPEFAKRIELGERLHALDGHNWPVEWPDYAQERAYAIDHPYHIVGNEHYNSVASAVGIEPRDPFLSLRVIRYSLSLPMDQRIEGGWPKVILRRAMVGLLPDQVIWRCGNEHLGLKYSKSFLETINYGSQLKARTDLNSIAEYVDVERVGRVTAQYESGCEPRRITDWFDIINLHSWIQISRERPRVKEATWNWTKIALP